MKENNLRDLFNYALEQDTKVRRGIIYSVLNKIFDLAPPVLIGIAIEDISGIFPPSINLHFF